MDLREFTEEIDPIFAAMNLHREEVAAMRLFQEAVRQDAAGLRVAFLGELAIYLKTVRQTPGFRFVPHERPFLGVN